MIDRMRRPVLLLAAGAALVAPAAAGAASDSGYVTNGFGSPATHRGTQGAAWLLHFRDRSGRAGRRYTVCLSNLDVGADSRRCYRRRTRARGRDRVDASLHVNDDGGPGRWEVRWKRSGRVVDRWRFIVEPEPVGPEEPIGP